MNTNQPEIRIRTDKVYGEWVFYPNCRLSAAIADTARTKTLTRRALNILARAGFVITLDSPLGSATYSENSNAY